MSARRRGRSGIDLHAPGGVPLLSVPRLTSEIQNKNMGGTMRRRDLLKAIPLLMTPSLARADTLPLRFIPNANLTSLDPIWTTALVAQAHGYLVYDTLYGLDASNRSQPQMCAGHDVSADELTWTFTLRDGLTFH